MKRRLWVLTLVAFAATLLLAAGIYAAEMPKQIEIKSPEMEKGPVMFNHEKHVADYKLTCGECHHNDKGQPRTDMKAGDSAKPCLDCHNKPGEVKGKKAEGLSEKEKLAHIGNAFHKNCIDCHKEYDKKNNTHAAPTTCTKCHEKKEG